MAGVQDMSFFSSPLCPDLLWGPPNFLSNDSWGGGGEGYIPGDKAARAWSLPLTTI
jgi:hypothetical protein